MGPRPRPPRELISGSQQFHREEGFESPLLILVMQHYDGNDAQRAFAPAAGGHLALKILHETVGKMIFGVRAACRLAAHRSAMRAGELQPVVLRIAIQRSAPSAANSHSVQA